MPGEIFALVVIGILASTLISGMKLVINYLQSRKQPASGSLTESELRRMIEESVHASIAPLERRFDRIEGRMNRLLTAPEEHPQLAGREEDDI